MDCTAFFVTALQNKTNDTTRFFAKTKQFTK